MVGEKFEIRTIFTINKIVSAFFGQFGHTKNTKYLFKLKFGASINWNMLKSMVMLTFVVLEWKYLLEQIWSKKSKLYLKWNLVPRLIRQRWIWSRWLFFLLWAGSTFLGQIWSNLLKVHKRRFENLPISLSSCKNMSKISH